MRVKAAIIVGAALGALGFGLTRSGLLSPREPAEHGDPKVLETEAIAKGQRAYASLRMEALPSLGGVEAYKQTLRVAEVSRSDGGSADRAAAEEVLDHAAEFLYYRFGQDSAAEYRRWRRDRGYTMVDAATARRNGVIKRYEAMVGRPYPGDDELERVFDELWTASTGFGPMPNAVRAIASEPRGLVVVQGALTKKNPAAWPALSGSMSVDEWHGRTAGGHENFWIKPDAVRGELLNRGRVEVACVGVVSRYAGGETYPLRLMFYRAHSGGRPAWRLEAVQTLNADLKRLTMLYY